MRLFVLRYQAYFELYTPSVPATSKFQNLNTNSLASQYAATYGHSTSALLRRIVREIIYDAAPQQYLDLKILSLKPALQKDSDEFFYHEMGFGREPLINSAISGGAVAPAAGTGLLTVAIENIEDASVNTMVTFPDNTQAIIQAISGSSIVLKPLSGETLPTIADATGLGEYNFANLSPIEADGLDFISQYFRIETTERMNYVQMMIKAQRFGRHELYKYEKSGQLSNYLAMQKKRLYEQFRVDIANVYWNGHLGEVTITNGASSVQAKTADGIFPIMQKAGSPNTSVTVANLRPAFEEVALDTEFKAWGATRFAYGTPRALLALANQYKNVGVSGGGIDNIRFNPTGDMSVEIYLDTISIGSSRIVLVPVKRFEEPSCFPTGFASRIMIIDNESIAPCYTLPEEMGETLPRVNRGTRENFYDSWISCTHSIEFNNPLGCGWIDISDLVV